MQAPACCSTRKDRGENIRVTGALLRKAAIQTKKSAEDASQLGKLLGGIRLSGLCFLGGVLFLCKKANNRFGVVRRRMYCFRHSINGNLSGRGPSILLRKTVLSLKSPTGAFIVPLRSTNAKLSITLCLSVTFLSPPIRHKFF